MPNTTSTTTTTTTTSAPLEPPKYGRELADQLREERLAKRLDKSEESKTQ